MGVPIADREQRLAYHREYSRKYRRREQPKVRATQASQWAKYRQQAIEALGGACVRCGEADPIVLHCDHVDGGGAKDKQRRTAWQRLRAIPTEAHLYQLLCANCHARKTYEQGDHLPKGLT